jgi:hypothetical protein
MYEKKREESCSTVGQAEAQPIAKYTKHQQSDCGEGRFDFMF